MRKTLFHMISSTLSTASAGSGHFPAGTTRPTYDNTRTVKEKKGDGFLTLSRNLDRKAKRTAGLSKSETGRKGSRSRYEKIAYAEKTSHPMQFTPFITFYSCKN